MEKIIETLPELKAILLANKFHTFDYTEGLNSSNELETIELDLQDTCYHGYLITYKDEESLFKDIQSNIKSMDLEDGADDQYYDYSPSQVEAIIYAIPQLTQEHQDYTIEGLKTHLRNFIDNEDNDGDLIDSYSEILENIEKYESDHRETELFFGLSISETVTKISKL